MLWSLAVPSLLNGQASRDSLLSASSSTPDRYIIDVAALVRAGTARTLSDVLMSQVPGLLVTRGSGLNGTGASIRFAGVRSLMADLPPIIFLDGMRIDAREDDSQLLAGAAGPSRLDDIPIDDVQTIEVLRGPASTTLYGPGAGAGVVLIRTKEGRSGPLRFEGYAQGARRTLPTRWPANWRGVDQDNPSLLIQREGCNLTSQASGSCTQDFVQHFNPLVERNPFASAPHRQIGLSATAGPSWGAFRISGTLDGSAAAFSVPTVTWGDDYTHGSVRATGTVHPIRNVDLVAGIARISSRLQLPMYQPVRAALLGPSDSVGFSWGSLFQSAGTQELDRTLLSLDVRARPEPWLELHGVFGSDDIDQNELSITPGQSRATGERDGLNQRFALNATASDIAWRGLHFTTMIGLERLRDRGDARLTVIRPDTVSSCGTGSQVPCSYSFRHIRTRRNSFGIYAAEQVGLRGRLFVTAALRHDAFDDDHAPSQTHPSLALDWIARPEQGGTLGKLAFRATYGTAGPPAPTFVEVFIVSPFPVAPEPKPERTRELALSAEASGLTRRWRAQTSVYDLRSRVLDFTWVSGLGGLTPAFVDGGEISNRGVTASFWANLISTPALGWEVLLSLWGNRNRVVKRALPQTFYGDFPPFHQSEAEGYPANGYWGRQISFADANGDGIIAFGEIDATTPYTWAGTPYPTQGAVLTSSWRIARRWRVTTILDYRAGQTLFNRTENVRCLLSRCRERNDPATPLADQATAVAANMLPLGYFEDADYVKLREIVLSFEVPEKAAGAVGARDATIMLAGSDLATWSKYSGADPEAGGYGFRPGGTPTVVRDYGTVPLPRTWMLHVRVSY